MSDEDDYEPGDQEEMGDDDEEEEDEDDDEEDDEVCCCVNLIYTNTCHFLIHWHIEN